jgi:RND superfamily putative drug exporter
MPRSIMLPKSLEDTTRHRRFWLAGVGCGAALLLAAQSFYVQGRLETAAHVGGSEAERVDQELAQQFQSPFVHRAVLVIRGLPSADTDDGKKILREIAAAVRREPGVSGTFSYLDWSDPIFLGRGGGTFMVVGLAGSNDLVDAAIPNLRNRAQGLRIQLLQRYPAVKFELTGETPLNFDLRKVSSDDVRSAERRIFPIIILLLLVTFAGLAAALVPLAVGLLAMLMTLGAAAVLSRWLHLSILLQNIATMLGLGLGIDYALLMVSRFREALASGQSAAAASSIAARRAGRTLLISASTVAIGFAALLVIPISDVRSIGAAGFLVAGSCVFLANLILPPILGLLGPSIDAGSLPFLRRANPDSSAARDRWRAWTRIVTARPWIALFLAASPLLWLASQALQLSPGLPRIDWLPQGAESVRALHSLDAMGRTEIVHSLRVILELPRGSEVSTYSGWNGIRQLAARLAGDGRADRVISLPSLMGRDQGPSFLPLVPAETRRNFLRRDGGATLLEILPGPGVTTNEQGRWVRELRSADAGELTGVAGATIRVGGIAALNEDYDSVIRDGLPRVTMLVAAGTLLALLLGFRAVAVAVKAIVLNFLTVAAALGALVLVFQEGHGSVLLGMPAATGAVFSIVPIVAFAVVFGLSMDYEVFLVARVLEARRSGFSEVDAIVEGVARTGGLITSAAAIMVAVFAAFALGDVLVIKMLGFTLAVAVLIDATLVRMVVGPALLRLGGDWNWWPWGLAGACVAAPDTPVTATDTTGSRQ